MMNADNVIVLKGRLTAAPELRSTSEGIEVCSFCIAVDRGYQGKNKERIADFIPCVAWRQNGTFISTYFGKGDMITVAGSLQGRKWVDKDGNNRTAYEVIVESARFCGGKAARTDSPNNTPVPEVDTLDSVDDDLPF